MIPIVGAPALAYARAVFYKADPGGLEDGYVGMLPGIRRKTLVYGDRTLFTEFRMDPGSRLPAHAHPYEQTGYLVRGRIRVTVGGHAMLAGPGDAWCIPSGVQHEAEILEESVAIEVFSPAREDYLPSGGTV